MNSNGWKPIRRGPIYCSPGCGAKCLHIHYTAAVAAAEACKARMQDPSQWVIQVHENMGWFWGLRHVLGHISVRGGQVQYQEDPTKGFHAMLNSDADSSGCNADWHDDREFDDPNEAVIHRLKFAKRKINGAVRLMLKFGMRFTQR